MTDHDAHEFAWLAAWIATADLPADLYRLPLDPWGWATLLVADPALSHRHLRETVAGHPVGQVRAAALVRMRLLRRLAAAGWKLTE